MIMKSRVLSLMMVVFVCVAVFGGTHHVFNINHDGGEPIYPKGPDLSGIAACVVVEVSDVHSIIIKEEGKTVSVRLVGVEVSEKEEGFFFLRNLLKGEKVYLVNDPQADKLNLSELRLAYVYRAPDGLFINAELIRQGYGCVNNYLPFKYMKEFNVLEGFAKKAGKGVWGKSRPTKTLPTDKPKKDPRESLKMDDGLLVDPAFDSFSDPNNSPLSVFKKFRKALQTDDLEKVLSCMNPYETEKNREFYGKMRPHFAKIAKDMKGLVIVPTEVLIMASNEEDEVHCDLLREEDGEMCGYPVMFFKDENGKWFIYEF